MLLGEKNGLFLLVTVLEILMFKVKRSFVPSFPVNLIPSCSRYCKTSTNHGQGVRIKNGDSSHLLLFNNMGRYCFSYYGFKCSKIWLSCDWDFIPGL